MNEKGQFTELFLVFIIFVFGLATWVYLGGLGANLTTSFYVANQSNIDNIQNQIADIDNPELQSDINDMIENYNNQQETGISLFMLVSTFGGVITILTIVFVLFLLNREKVQATRGFGGVG